MVVDVTLLALLPAGVALLLILLPLAAGVLVEAGVLLAGVLDDLPWVPGELDLESGLLTRLLGVEERSLALAASRFLELLGVTSSSISNNLGGRLFFLVLLVDMMMTS